ncbi:MAG: VWA domain-containing protein [Bryobacteraceae bacterium]|jgi:VWFA-related protein
MKALRYTALLSGFTLLSGTVYLAAQQGPESQSSETVAKPKKKDAGDASAPTDSDLPKIPSKFNPKDKVAPEGLPTFKSDVTTIQVDVAVLDNKGRFIPKIPRGNFRILEDGAPQPVTGFSVGNEAPMTVAMVIEFSNLFQSYWSEGWYQTLVAAYGFVETLKPEDYAAVIAFDMRPEILTDFTTDRMKLQEAMQRLRIPGFSESNLFDALVDTEDRMKDIEGRKAIILFASGRDTFSRITFDKCRKTLQEDAVPVYAISLLQSLRERADARGSMGPISQLDFLQADNEMKTFAKETGGQSYFPRFYGEFPSIYRSIQEALRNQYSISYHPTNTARDGKYRKIKVELVNPETNEPLRIVENGKPIKYQVIAKAGYTAPREVE